MGLCSTVVEAQEGGCCCGSAVDRCVACCFMPCTRLLHWPQGGHLHAPAPPHITHPTPCCPCHAAGDGTRTRLGVSRHASRDNDAGPQLTQRQVQMQARLGALHAGSDEDDDAFFEQQLEEAPRRPVAEGPRRPGRPAKPKDDREPLRNRENPWLDALKGRFKPIQVGGSRGSGWRGGCGGWLSWRAG